MTLEAEENISLPAPQDIEKPPPPPTDIAPKELDSKENNNSGFDIVRFIRNQIDHKPCFRDLFISYTETMSERTVIFWTIYLLCFILDLITRLFLKFLLVITITIIVFAFGKIVGVDLFILKLIGK